MRSYSWSLTLAGLAVVLLTAGCASVAATPNNGPSASNPPSQPEQTRAPLPALAHLDVSATRRLDLVRLGADGLALEVLAAKGNAWVPGSQSPAVPAKAGVGTYILEQRDLPGHPGAIVAGQAPFIVAFDASTLTPLDYAALAAPAAPGPGTQIVVDKGINILYLFKDGKLVKDYHVATGRDYNGPQPTWNDYQDNYVTPLGSFSIAQRVVNPVYTSYHTGQSIKGGDPDNPVGTRWLGFPVLKPQGKYQDTGGIWAIHGTNEPDKIGTYVSDGCIRMHTKEVEELFDQVPTGTKLTIVNSFPVK